MRTTWKPICARAAWLPQQENRVAEWTVGRLAKRFGLSRSTLLYYDSIGLLRPRQRASGDYRAYGEAEAWRLERILLYRSLGLSLAEIKAALDAPETAVSRALAARLKALEREAAAVRAKQRLALSLLGGGPELPPAGLTDRASLTALLEAAGMDREEMLAMHREWERRSPDKHRRLLMLLGFAGEELEDVLRSSREEDLREGE
nr:MerR family transcriptional regulator [Fundidesulfovibrio soli]